MRPKSTGKGIAVAALLISLVALWLSWSAYNRTADEALEDTITQRVYELTDQVERRIRGEREAAPQTD